MDVEDSIDIFCDVNLLLYSDYEKCYTVDLKYQSSDRDKVEDLSVCLSSRVPLLIGGHIYNCLPP